jgi:orotate phosphoribosyltransferase
MYDRKALMELVKNRALRFGDFTLASGKKAKYYLDGKQVTLDSRGAVLIGEGLLDLLSQHGQLPKAVGGMAIGADPITAAIITVAGLRNLSLAGVLVRKESKGHGTNRYVEGPVQPGDTVAIVEDVVTTGGSSLEAIKRVQEFGLKVTCVAAIIDRMEGGAKAFAEQSIPFYSLLTIRDFGIEPPVV